METNKFLEEYRDFCRSTAIYPEANTGSMNELMYLGLGLNGEAGEVADKVKKLYRDFDMGSLDSQVLKMFLSQRSKLKLNLIKELGDVIWYLTRLADTLNFDITEVIIENMEKLTERQNKELLGGSGDNR